MIAIPGKDVTSLVTTTTTTTPTCLLGSGLVPTHQGRIISVVSGKLCVLHQREEDADEDNVYKETQNAVVKKTKVWVSESKKRYAPLVGDAIVGVVVEALGESYLLDVGGPRLVMLDSLAFEGASKRNAPELGVGATVFARVIRSGIGVEPEVTCQSGGGSSNKKDWTTGQSTYGELLGGCVFGVSRAQCRSLAMPGNALLNALGDAFPYEVAIGMNGRVWVSANEPTHVIVVGNALRSAQGKNLDKAAATVLVRKLCKAARVKPKKHIKQAPIHEEGDDDAAEETLIERAARSQEGEEDDEY